MILSPRVHFVMTHMHVEELDDFACVVLIVKFLSTGSIFQKV